MKLLKVKEANKDKFKECTAKSKPMLILFYAEWCPHCQMFKPIWKELVALLEKSKKIQVAEVEYENMKHVPKKYKNIRGFPTLQVIQGGKIVSEYDGNRTVDDLKTYIQSFESA